MNNVKIFLVFRWIAKFAAIKRIDDPTIRYLLYDKKKTTIRWIVSIETVGIARSNAYLQLCTRFRPISWNRSVLDAPQNSCAQRATTQRTPKTRTSFCARMHVHRILLPSSVERRMDLALLFFPRSLVEERRAEISRRSLLIATKGELVTSHCAQKLPMERTLRHRYLDLVTRRLCGSNHPIASQIQIDGDLEEGRLRGAGHNGTMSRNSVNASGVL